MDEHVINFTDNGTKILLTAGKYCDKNIRVNVTVPKGLPPTQFTNVLDLSTTLIKEGYRAITNTYSETSDGVAVSLFVKKGTHDIRVRGKWIWWFLGVQISNALSNLRTNVYFSTATQTSDNHGGSSLTVHTTNTANAPATLGNGCQFSIDQYGDWYLRATVPNDGYLIFSLKDMSKVFQNSGVFECAPIITIDEPIGYVEVTA